MNKNIIILIALSFLFSQLIFAQVGKNQTLFVSVSYNDGNMATISWSKDENFDGNYHIYVNKSGNNQQLEYSTYVTSDKNSWTDISYQKGDVREYAIYKVNKENKLVSYDFVTLGLEVEQPNLMGGILLLVDDAYKTPLSTEVEILIDDLEREGWKVYLEYVSRAMTPIEVKNIILSTYGESNSSLKTLYLLGHIPVPYSGYFSNSGDAPPPDGHVEGSGNHTGAWPSDLYYGDIDGIWTDKTVNYEDSKQERNNNRPGDGKFDQTTIPSLIDLEVGRVDFYDMPAFSESDTLLLKKYLDKAHRWRNGQIETINRGLIDDNFKGLQISNTAYKTINYLLGVDSLFDNRDYLTELRSGDYLFSFGMGAGSYTSCNGVGKSADFAEQDINAIFTGIAGSYFGDWDSKNNLLRAALASGALASFWGGIPNWYLQPMAVGKTIGYCTRYSQNAGFYSFNYSQQKVHIALMGDPTLKLVNLTRSPQITAMNNIDDVLLEWDSVKDFDGFNVYRLDTTNNESIKLNDELLVDDNFIDKNAPTGNYIYQLRGVKNIFSANNSQLAMGQSTQSDKVSVVSISSNDSFTIAPNPSTGNFRLQIADDDFVSSVRIQDMNGNIVYETKRQLTMDEIISTSLKSGNYLLIATTNKAQFAEKIQIIR